MERQEKWDQRFLDLADFISTFSKDPSTKVGAVITKNVNEIVSIGYNGFPKSDPDSEEEYINRETKLGKIIHGEMNAVKFAQSNGYHDLKGCTVYTTPFPPCYDCAIALAKLGVSRVVSIEPTREQEERWGDSFRKTYKLFKFNKIELTLKG